MKSVFTLKNLLTCSRSCKTLALVAAFSLLTGALKAQTVYALSGTSPNYNLVTFSPIAPGTITSTLPLTGIANGQTVEGMDFRPATGQLFALGYNTSSGLGQLYIINIKSGAATPVGTGATLTTGLTTIGFDFNPTVDRIRVTAGGTQNYRMNPLTGGLVQPDGNLNYPAGGTPNATAVAYTRSYLGTGTTTMYVYDFANNSLARSTNPNAGTLVTVGSTGITPAAGTGIDMDIINRPNSATDTAYLLVSSNFYRITLSTGATTLLGTVGTNATRMAINFPPVPLSKIVYALSGNSLIAFNSATPGTVKTIGTVNPAAGQSIVGMDFRPATGQLFAMGYASTGAAQIYTVDTTTAALTAIGTTQTIAAGLTRIGFDFNPVPDRIRVTASGTQNYRFNPNDGTLMITDANLNYPVSDPRTAAAPGVVTVAYTNSVAGATATTMYAFDFTNRIVASSSNPNAGQLTIVDTINITPPNADSVDMDISTRNDTSTTAGNSFALLAASGTLYVLNLGTGVIGSLGTIGTGLAVSDIAIYIAPPTPSRMVYALSGANLVVFNTTTPGTVSTIAAVTYASGSVNLPLVGLDFRPANNGLYAFGYDATSGTGQVYTLNTTTAVATAVGTTVSLPTGMMNIGFDFNPMADRIRLTSSTGQNYRLNPNDGTIVTPAPDGALAYPNTNPPSDVNNGVAPAIAAIGYTNSYATPTATTLFYYDYGTDVLATTAAPNGGILSTVGNSGIQTSTATGLDMDIFYNNGSNVAFLSATVAGNTSNLYTVNTRTGELKFIGAIGATISEMAIVNFNALPITLVDFTGRKAGSSSELSWATQSESNNDYFVIERSSNGTSFSPVSGHIASLAPGGNSGKRLEYSYTDVAPAKGINYYRLVQVDKDGKSTVSKIVQLRFDGGYNISLYPNPAISFININGNLADRSDLQIRLSDMTGKTISTTMLKGQQGNWNTQLSASRLAAGTYYVTVLKDNIIIYNEAVQKK